jgi:hypothetical protein
VIDASLVATHSSSHSNNNTSNLSQQEEINKKWPTNQLLAMRCVPFTVAAMTGVDYYCLLCHLCIAVRIA